MALTDVAAGQQVPALLRIGSDASLDTETASVWDDLFAPPRSEEVRLTGSLFASAPAKEWAIMCGVLAVLIVVDAMLLHHQRGRCYRASVVLMWLVVACAYGLHYCQDYGRERGTEWFLGYVLEIVLSVDNVFVFHLIFETFVPPRAQQLKAMYLGIAGALIFRLLMFFALGQIVHAVHWIRAVFGIILIYSGMQAVREDDDDDPSQSFVVRGLRSCLGSRLLPSYDEDGRMFVRDENGQLQATMLVPLVACIEATDVIFAADSLSAKVTQIHNQHAAFSSSAFAILALRALFFVLRDLVDYFDNLKYGLCIILIFIGIELLLSDFVQFHASALLIVIVSVFSISIASSVHKKYTQGRRGSRAGSEGGGSAAASAEPPARAPEESADEGTEGKN